MALRRIGFIGFGKMGTAFATGMINAGKFQQAQIKVFDPVLHNQSIKFNKASSNNDLAAWSDVIVLATKPKEISNVCNEISSTLKSRPIKPFVLSVAAGTTISTISQALQCNNIPIVRAMPNTPSLIGLGATAYFANEFVEDDEIKVVDEILDATGIAVKVENEGILDIVTAASGSGPAYFFLIMEHMIDSAVRLGLPREKATILVKQTCYGAGIEMPIT
jgi:pyrroline-5-carboxylate reductase